MPGWVGSNRLGRLPTNWKAIRARILIRDNYQCCYVDSNDKLCMNVATDVDHIVNNDDNNDYNLQSLCSYHHRMKSGKEGARASNNKQQQRRDKAKQQSRKHPGI